MRLFGVVASCGLVASMLCACGSSEGAGPHADAGPEASPVDGTADAPPVKTSACDNAGLLGGCAAGACTVSATGKPLPDGASITVTQKPAPPDLSGDAIGSVLCSIALPAAVKSVPNLSLSIAGTAGSNAAAVLFQYVSSSLSRVVLTSQRSGSAVVGLVTAPGDFGATERPGPWSLQANVGLDVSSSADTVSLLRNLSSQPMTGAFYDGTHLFVCNGPRLLIYNGIPATPAVKPDVVLGQADLNTLSSQTTSSLFGAFGCSGLWSDGTRLVAAHGNRVLIWNAIPSQNAAPADIVLGQPDFSSNKANNGGVKATSLTSVASVDSDGTRLAAAEVVNNRVLLWNKFPNAVDQPADFVIGQPDFTTNAPSHGATPIDTALGCALVPQGLFVTGYWNPGLVHVPDVTASNPAADFTVLPRSFKLQPPDVVFSPGRVARTPSGGLAVRDTGVNRIEMLKALPTGPAHVDFVLGQPDILRVVASPVSASVVSLPAGEQGLGAGKVVLVPDSRRLLVFDASPSFNFEPASRVLGQAGFATNGLVDYRGISASTLGGPADVAVSSALVAVADRGNNRVLLYRKTDVAARDPVATVVLGQADSTSYVANLDQRTPSAARMSGPAGVALDGTHLIVADTENHRVLIWNSVPSVTGTPADIVLGQADFSGRRPNHGRGDANGDGFSDANADGFFYPVGVASDATHLFVADRLNNRVLVWNAFPTANGQAADAVLGQANFTNLQSNKSNGPFIVVPDGLNLPTGVTLAGTTLWIADTENNRVVRWDNATTVPTPGVFVGQALGSAVANPNYAGPTDVNVGFATSPVTTAASVLRPRAVAVVNGRIFVSETDSNRVHMFDATSLAPAGELGQSSDTTASANANGVTASSISTPLGMVGDGSTLWIADSSNHRVLGFDVTSPPSTAASATAILGQPNFSTNGFNQASTAAGGVTSQPGGAALANGQLYVADTGNHRVLVMQTPVSAGQMPVRIYGQPDPLQALANSGGPPSARTLNAPRGVFVDAKHLIIADTGNHRVLIYDPSAGGPDASVVLGQSTFTGGSPNTGGASASSLQAPVGVYSDGTSLWVADTGNHRVLVWKAFPTSNGQAADLVLGQTSFSGILSNQGGAVASASTLSFPSSIDLVGGVLYVADAGNNRVVSFSTPPAISGASADGVLGQMDLAGRRAAVMPNDTRHLAGPVAIADDGENMYVVDRDLARVLVYPIGTIASGVSASLSVGASGGLALSRPGAVAVERSSFFTSRLYVADTGNNQVAVVQSVSRLVAQ